jgi:hypothetical protein
MLKEKMLKMGINFESKYILQCERNIALLCFSLAFSVTIETYCME